ncbi:MAG: prepilin-type N-terminal cleavage/methylation domain-containing protein [Desulfobacteraceae bacterium]|nr:MAG: prepilin-type N-terminal cleavage/methylation domain-containing protein [Desulfobacteraceae bacterium]
MTHMKREYFCAGFSLVELMVVIAVISILMAIAVPAFFAWKPNYQLQRAARDLYSNMQKVKIEAIKRNTNVVIVFNPPNTYTITVAGNPIFPTIDLRDYGNGIEMVMPPAAGSVPDDLGPNGTPVSYAANSLSFNARGMLPMAGTGYVYLRNAKGNGYAVGTPGITGIVRILKWFPASNNWQ